LENTRAEEYFLNMKREKVVMPALTFFVWLRSVGSVLQQHQGHRSLVTHRRVMQCSVAAFVTRIDVKRDGRVGDLEQNATTIFTFTSPSFYGRVLQLETAIGTQYFSKHRPTGDALHQVVGLLEIKDSWPKTEALLLRTGNNGFESDRCEI